MPSDERWIEVVVGGRPPTPNARRHWRQTANDNAEWKGWARNAALAAVRTWEARHGALWEPLSRCSVVVTMVVPDRRARDYDNAVASMKPVLDGIVTAGIMIGDSNREILGYQLAYLYEKGRSEVRVRVQTP